ncbi:hypothetical protein [Actinopolyspora halophila]|uniref:hypothetical protein n=1 Tax=Actinopolyspora halophila TaxID=1850 RepID=UPI0012F93A86|nr:hypothetical protein [Actinopolyspora halophila]
MRRRRSWRLAAGAVLASLVLSSCALPQGEGQSKQADSAADQAPKYLRELPFRDERSLAQAARLDSEVLPIAPCALHDPDAASEVTGLPGDSIAPGDEINQCTLRLGKHQDRSEGWVFDIIVGPTHISNYRLDSQLVRMSGSRFYRQISKHDGMVSSCSYFHDLTKGSSIELRVGFDGYPADEQRERKFRSRTCDLGKKYLERTATRWFDPVRRDQAATEPAMLLGMESPCAAMGWARNNLPPAVDRVATTEVSHSRTSGCSLRDQNASGSGSRYRAKVRFLVTDRPENLLGREEYRPVDIRGRRGASSSESDECEVTVPFRKNPHVIDIDERRPDSEVLTQNIRVTTPDCDSSSQLAAVLLEKLHS